MMSTTALADTGTDRTPAAVPPSAPPPPQRTDEAWRYADLKQLEVFDRLVPAPPVPETDARALADRSHGIDNPAARFVFVNDSLVSGPAELPAGVVCLPLSSAREQHPGLVNPHFMAKETTLGSARFAALHRAHTTAGVFVYVPDGVVVDRPIEVFHWLGGGDGTAVFPHTLVVTGTNSQVAVVDHFLSWDDSAGASVGVCDIVAGQGSHVTYANAQRWNLSSHAIQIGSTTAARDAHVKSLFLNLGGRWVRSETTTHVDGPGARSDMLAASLAADNQHFDQRTLQLHHAPHTASDLLYKNALYDHAQTIFGGLIVVDRGAHYTDAYQKCRNLLMSDTCEATSMPGLQIDADQVRCSHGATSGRISEDQKFYLLSRGIPPHSADHLIALGFIREAIAKLDNDPIEAAIDPLVETKLREVVSRRT